MRILPNVREQEITGKEFMHFAAQAPALLERMPCAAYIIKDDPNLTVIFGNTAFYELFGCTPDDMQHKYANRLSALISPDSLREFESLKENESEAAAGFQQHIKREGNDAWIYTQVKPLHSEQGFAFCCISFDMTGTQQKLQLFQCHEDDSQLIAEQINIDAFGYHLRTGALQIYSSHTFLFPELSASFPHEAFPETLLSSGQIHPEYVQSARDAFDAIGRGSTNTVCELRMKNKAGKYIWTRLSLSLKQTGQYAGNYVVGVLANINQQKELSLQYLNETQFYQVMLSEKAAFAHVDVTRDHCTRFGGIWNLYNEIIDKVSYSSLIEEFINKVVHPEDRRHYLELMQRDNFIQSLNNGIDQLGCEFRRIVEQNKMVWMELRVHLFREPFTHHILALLYIMDIDERKKQELALLHDSERDSLTNIYNKKMAESSIRDYLKRIKEDELCAFMILDMDNFKQINDTYGHKRGDQVLVRLTEILGETFRRYDIIGRFGGDEFILFLKGIVSSETVHLRLKSLYEQLSKEKDPAFSCSIGITLVHSGDSYDQIFQQADTALYAAKSQGKGQYIFFNQKAALEPPVKSTAKCRQQPIESLIQEQPQSDEISFEAFLAEQGDMAYLVDPESFTLLCGNKAFYDRIGITAVECTGLKCYEALHKRESPCPFCSKANWSTDKFYLWRNLNTALEQEFLIKNKLVQWRGKEALLAISVDISNDKSIVDSMENGATESHSILSGIQRMTEAANLTGALNSALETISYFFRADAARIWQRNPDDGFYFCAYAWSKSNQNNFFGAAEVNTWLQGRNWDHPILIESPEAMLCYSYDMYCYMKANNIVNQRWLQLRDGKDELGCIVIENSSSNFQNVAFLESFTVFMRDEIKKRRLMEDVLYSNEHDELTALLSRKSFERYSISYNGDNVSEIGVVLANFDNLKGVNSAKGFNAGNEYLKQFADILKRIFPNDSVFRLNGDEFLAIATGIGRSALELRIQKLKAMIKRNGAFTVSIGYSWDNVENDLALLVEQATNAMKVDKKRHLDAGMVSMDTERRKLLSELMTSLEKQEFEVFLQPKVEMAHSNVIGAEALIRYRHKELGIIGPGKFISTLEKNNVIRYIDLFVFEEVCRFLAEWKHEGLMMPIVSLNFSRLTLLERDILSSMEKIISKYDIPRRYIEIEITESMSDIGKSILYQVVRELYDAGFNISLDDFGTKYTNLSILADIDFSMLKLDKSLIETLVDQTNNQVILKNIIYMCRDLGIDVIAEGVETPDQAKLLQSLQCRLGQGYLYGKPMPVPEFKDKFLTDTETL